MGLIGTQQFACPAARLFRRTLDHSPSTVAVLLQPGQTVIPLGEDLGNPVELASGFKFDGQLRRAVVVPGEAILEFHPGRVVIEIEETASQRLDQAGFACAIRTMQDDDPAGQIVEIYFGDAPPMFDMDAAENHAPTS